VASAYPWSDTAVGALTGRERLGCPAASMGL